MNCLLKYVTSLKLNVLCATQFFLNYKESLVTVAQIFCNFMNSRVTRICPQLFSISCGKNYRVYLFLQGDKNPKPCILHHSGKSNLLQACDTPSTYLNELGSYYKTTCILIGFFNQLLGRNSYFLKADDLFQMQLFLSHSILPIELNIENPKYISLMLTVH